MTACSRSVFTQRRSAALRGAVDAEARRRHRLEARVGDALVAVLALAVVAGVELAEGVLDLRERLVELAGERLDLAAFGGDLPGVGEVVVEVGPRTRSLAQPLELIAQAIALVLELVAQHRVGRVGHGLMIMPGFPAPHGVAAAPKGGAQRRARGWARSYTARSRSGETFVYTCVVESDACPSSSCTTRMSAPWSSMWVAHEWRRTCGKRRSPSPARSPAARTMSHAPCRVRRPPRAFRNTGSPRAAPPGRRALRSSTGRPWRR